MQQENFHEISIEDEKLKYLKAFLLHKSLQYFISYILFYESSNKSAS